MKIHPLQALWAFPAALLLAGPAWAGEGGGIGSDIGFELQYDENEEDSGSQSGYTFNPGATALREFSYAAELYEAQEQQQFSTTTKLKGNINFGQFGQNFGASDEDLTTDAGLTYRPRLNFDSSFTGSDRLRVRLQNGDGSAPTDLTSNPPNFGQVEEGFGSNTVRYSFNVGARWNLNLEYDVDRYSSGYITGERAPEENVTIGGLSIPTGGFLNALESPRYVSPTFAGFSLSSSWDEGSVDEVALRYAGEFGAVQQVTGFQFQGAWGTITLDPTEVHKQQEEEQNQIEAINLIPDRFLLAPYKKGDKTKKDQAAKSVGLRGFAPKNGRGTESETSRAESFVNPRRYYLGSRLRF